jgi:pimeloyl-ACP methyl ester carboxylesterase
MAIPPLTTTEDDPMHHSSPVDGFSLAYTDTGWPISGDRDRVAILLHGWPGDSTDYRRVIPLLQHSFRIIAPDLRGFGASDRHLLDPDIYYSPSAQARGVAGLIDELGLQHPVIAGYDVGSRIAQTLAREHPTSVGGLAVSPPLPGSGARMLEEQMVSELWYMYFHRSPISVALLDGQRDKIHTYLRYFWQHLSGPEFTVEGTEFESLVDAYARLGAFETATNLYRVGNGYIANAITEQAPPPMDRIMVPTHVLWQELDPLFPRAWSDRLGEFFADITMHPVDGIGHFTPLEAPAEFASIVDAAYRGYSTKHSRPQGLR